MRLTSTFCKLAYDQFLQNQLDSTRAQFLPAKAEAEQQVTDSYSSCLSFSPFYIFSFSSVSNFLLLTKLFRTSLFEKLKLQCGRYSFGSQMSSEFLPLFESLRYSFGPQFYRQNENPPPTLGEALNFGLCKQMVMLEVYIMMGILCVYCCRQWKK